MLLKYNRFCQQKNNAILFLIIAIGITIGIFFTSCKKEKADPLTSLGISKGDTILRKGALTQFKYGYNPHNGVLPDFTWESSDKNVLTVKNDGSAVAVNVGKAIITLRVNDGTGLTSLRTIYVFEKPTISLLSISNITYYTADFSLKYYLGGGNIANTSLGIVWDTIPTLKPTKLLGECKFNTLSNVYNVDLLDPNKKMYARAFIKTPLDTVYSDSLLFTTLPVPEGTLGNYMLNISLAWGSVAKYNDWIYFVSAKDTNDRYNNGKLFRIKEDLTNKQRISEARLVSSINIIGSDIYCTGVEMSTVTQSRIMRMKSDGSQFSLYGKGFSNSNYRSWGPMLVCGNYIYPSYGGFFRFSTDLKTSIPNIGVTQYTNYFNNKLYFIINKRNGNNDSIYTINESNLDGSELKELYKGIHYYYFAGNGNLGIYKNASYFIEKGVFKKFDLSSPDIVEALPISTYSYNIVNDAIYFSNRADSGKLYVSDLGGLLVRKVCDDPVNSILVIDNWLYYYSGIHLYRIKQDGTGRQLVD